MQNLPTDTEKIRELIKKLLAEHIGVEPEDIEDDDFLIDDLHMNPSEIIDFSEKLKEVGFDITRIDLMNVKNVEDIVDALSSH